MPKGAWLADFWILVLTAFVFQAATRQPFLVLQTVIWEAWCSHFGTMLAPWGTIGTAGGTRVRNRTFIDLGTISEFHLEKFLETNA